MCTTCICTLPAYFTLDEMVIFNSLYTGRLFHCFILEETICHFRGIRSIVLLLFYFLWKILLANSVDPDQMPHYVASDLGLHCLPMTLLQVCW